MRTKYYYSLILTLLFSYCSFAQIITHGEYTAEHYIKDIFVGTGIKVGQIKVVGAEGGFGQFSADSSILGLESGLILSTGNIDSINGPNNNKGYTSQKVMPVDKNELTVLRRGDRDLRRINQTKNSDVCAVEFEFIPINNKLHFNYVFASEEYVEYVHTSFNDVFAFFLSGPRIKKKVNIAVLPDGETPVSINTVNNKENKEYFINNASKFNRFKHKINGFWVKNFNKKPEALAKYQSNLLETIQFDGLTKVLEISYDVIPYRKYKIKLAIGDGSDGLFDSAIFLQAGSFISTEDPNGLYYDSILTVAEPRIILDSIERIKQDVVEMPQLKEESIINIPKAFQFSDVFFSKNSYKIEPSFYPLLDSIANYLSIHNLLECTIVGHTDHHGSMDYNQTLSLRRATVVAEYIMSKGIRKERFQLLGSHFSKMDAEGKDKQEGSINRRVEIILEFP